MEVYRSGCPAPQNYFWDLEDSATLKTVQQSTALPVPLILVGTLSAAKAAGQGIQATFWHVALPPGMRQCVVKQFQPSGNLTSTQLELPKAI